MNVLLTSLGLSLALVAAPAQQGPSRHVDPTTGTGGHAHTFPGPLAPFGMVQLSPDTRLSGWDGCSGYHDTDRVVYGFSHTHLSGTGCSDYGDLLFLPATGPVKWKTGYRGINDVMRPHDPAGYGSRFRKETEKASAGYYGVRLDDYAVKAELTATPRVGVHRYTFEQGGKSHILFDLTHRDTVLDSQVRVVNATEIEGFRRAKAWSADRRWYYVARFSKPFQAEFNVDDQVRAGLKEAQGKNVKLALHYTTKAGEVIQVKVGLSPTSIEAARRNLDAEVQGFAFDQVVASTRKAWDQELGRFEVRGGSPEDLKTFYTALYHSMIHPSLAQDVDGTYLGRDFKVHKAQGHGYYSVFSLWDTFRALHPLLTLTDRKRTLDFIQTFIRQHEQGGRLPIWELSSNETFCMIGYHSIPVIWDAWQKGIRDFDAPKALEAMVHTAKEDRVGLKPYQQHGFVPVDKAPEAVSKTLEYAYDDWCIAQFAKALGRTDIAKEFTERSQFWKNVFDPSTGFMRGRANGRWHSPFDPREVNFNYTEANSWQYSFFVPHDLEGLMTRLGGGEAFARKLDQMFEDKTGTTGRQQVDISGLVGQYAHGNEPSHHVAYLYNFAGQPWKTQARVTEIRDSLYGTGPEGLCGNDDAGQMSAWYVLSALGFYPVTPGSNDYILGSPKFPEVRIHLENGKTFTVLAKGARKGSPYIQSATLNGKPHAKSFFRHEDLAKGGTLALVMGNTPNTTWGARPEDRPTTRLDGAPLLTSPTVLDTPRVIHGPTQVKLGVAEPGAAIHYTLDGSEPTQASPRYTTPLEIKDDATLRMRAYKDGFAPSHPVTADFTLVTSTWKAKLNCTPNPQYLAGGPGGLVDGLRGGDDFRNGGWMGFEGQDLDVEIDFGADQPVNMLSLGCLQDLGSWIFLPESVTYLGSTDGRTWTPLGTVASTVDPKTEGPLRHAFTLKADGRTWRHVRAIAKAIKVAPLWHKGANGPAFLFTDELTVK